MTATGPRTDPQVPGAGLTAEPPGGPGMPGDGTAAGPAEAGTGGPRRIPDGHLLSNRYRLTERIAAGGMGEVWRGTDELLGRTVAVKLLPDAHAADEQFRARFRAEARYAAALSHPGIARVFDYGESDAGQPGAGAAYLVMELVEGEPLSATLAREGRLTAGVTLGIVAQAAGALHAAHTAGIVHRDVKPGNLLITPDGQVKITDFGIARAAVAAHLTQSGMVMGTAQYVSPEQATARPVTPATDIYSLGVVAYECLAGRPPFTADTPIALALAHVNERPPRLPGDVPPPVAALVGQMLAKEPSARPASARLVADRASALRDSRPAGEDAWAAGPAGPAAWVPEASPTGPRPRQPGTAPMAPAGPRRARSRRPAALIVAAGAVGAVVATSAVALMATNRHPAPAGTSTPASSAPAHRTHRPSHAPPPRSSAPGQPATPAAPAPSPAPSTRHPSPTPTTPATPATPTPSSPASSPPTSPPTSPPSTPPTSPTQSGSPASSSPNGTAQPGAAQPAAPSGLQAANVRTQDR